MYKPMVETRRPSPSTTTRYSITSRSVYYFLAFFFFAFHDLLFGFFMNKKKKKIWIYLHTRFGPATLMTSRGPGLPTWSGPAVANAKNTVGRAGVKKCKMSTYYICKYIAVFEFFEKFSWYFAVGSDPFDINDNCKYLETRLSYF